MAERSKYSEAISLFQKVLAVDPSHEGAARHIEQAKLQAAADYLQVNSQDGLLIEGHCDWYGTTDYNLALGDRRAKSIRDYLITLGVSGDRIETLSKGSLESTSGLSKPEAREDRRGKLIVLQ